MKRRCPKCESTEVKHIGSKTERLMWPGVALLFTGLAAINNEFFKYLFFIVLLLTALSIRSVFVAKEFNCQKCEFSWDVKK
ncbi:hypothetical protein SYNTR_1488 [Candidatus Syntrophocurvum alkaliphilum]|uniref:Uncharacterized protein n=1 Tax=Candidatus Syntrophocurvum alkaliphilum TaxID=2293317 RepID=A0A6I6DLR8_9FIRM|nr:hypothetical protein [Candidatus Syntrophocurvum alkaliphilum]QGU00082.1 hypothetical protein SYNTR_1488 [Candidatus Syntrophocurvum alkaliphilum]